VESTVVDLSGPLATLLRPGGIDRDRIEDLIGLLSLPGADTGDAPRLSPGMLASHYAPSLPLRLNAAAPAPDEAFLGFGPVSAPIRAPDLQLSVRRDTTEAAAHLFASLRALDRAPYRGIAVMPIPDQGLGLAINDRLRRAAAPRP
jgi:L-threonylcarbamoyladenylate synthase